MAPAEAYEFAGFTLDVRDARLRRGGETIPLPPKTFDVLVALVRRDGQLVDKDALMREVWPDTFIEEANISRHIWTLRRALGDDRLIETAPKRGYRLNAAVRAVADPEVLIARRTEIHTVTTEETIVTAPSRWWLWTAATVAAVGLAWLSWSVRAAPGVSAARRWFALAETARLEGRLRDAVPLYKQAIEVDPNLAVAESRLADTYGALREPAERHAHALRGHALRDHAPQRERLLVDATYYAAVGDRPREADALRLLVAAYPGDPAAHRALAAVYRETGRYEAALTHAREAARLDPGSPEARTMVARSLLDLNRLEEAQAAVAADRDAPSDGLHAIRFELAFMRGDSAAMQQELDWAARSGNDDAAALWQAQAHDFLGQRQKARALFARAAVLTTTQGGAQRAAEVAALNASRDSIVGACGAIDGQVAEALSARTFNTLTLAALARALCGDIAGARALAGELSFSSRLDWLNRTVSVPIIRAFVAASDTAARVRDGHAGGEDPNALARTIEPYELGQTLWPIYLRGLVHRKTGRLDDAAAAFRRILANRGAAGLSVRFPLAHLQLARTLAQAGDRAGSRKAYEEFLRIWKDADQDLPILIDADREYRGLTAKR